jgi:hypothetical protein
MNEAKEQKINLSTPLSIRAAFMFPLQNALARREVFIGALLLFVPVIGWILNMGHRIAMVHNMQHGQTAWPSWTNYPQLFRHGFITLLGMIEYHAPAIVVELIAWKTGIFWLHIVAAALWIVATVAVPGYMSHYCVAFDSAEVFNPFRAMRRVFEGGRAYWRAWAIALSALAISFTGLLIFGVGFLVTSVWFWQVAGFSFATVFTQKFKLMKEANQSSRT